MPNQGFSDLCILRQPTGCGDSSGSVLGLSFFRRTPLALQATLRPQPTPTMRANSSDVGSERREWAREEGNGITL